MPYLWLVLLSNIAKLVAILVTFYGANTPKRDPKYCLLLIITLFEVLEMSIMSNFFKE